MSRDARRHRCGDGKNLNPGKRGSHRLEDTENLEQFSTPKPKRGSKRDLPGGPAAETPSSQCRGPQSKTGSGN